MQHSVTRSQRGDREYRVLSRPGALHPPLARALALIAAGGALVDPCCGTGTVAIEAELADPTRRVLGFDLDVHALAGPCGRTRGPRAARAALLVSPDAFSDLDDRTGIRVAGARASISVLDH